MYRGAPDAKSRVWNGDGVTGDDGDGEVTGDKIFTGDITGDKIVTGEVFSPVKLVLKRDRKVAKLKGCESPLPLSQLLTSRSTFLTHNNSQRGIHAPILPNIRRKR